MNESDDRAERNGRPAGDCSWSWAWRRWSRAAAMRSAGPSGCLSAASDFSPQHSNSDCAQAGSKTKDVFVNTPFNLGMISPDARQRARGDDMSSPGA
jgi:hypothetical protein